MNPTARKFGAPDSLIAQYGSWLVLLRPKQVTLGSLVLVCTEPATAFGALSATALADLGRATAAVERSLKGAFRYDRLNYLMLMMVDPDVHFHVLPRYSDPREFAGAVCTDTDWPGPPDISRALDLGPAAMADLLARLREVWD